MQEYVPILFLAYIGLDEDEAFRQALLYEHRLLHTSKPMIVQGNSKTYILVQEVILSYKIDYDVKNSETIIWSVNLSGNKIL